MSTLQVWFDKYGESHQNPINKTFHWICVPVIFVSLIGLLSLLRLAPSAVGEAFWTAHLHAGTLLILVGLVFYLRLSLPMTVGMLLVSLGTLYSVAFINAHFGELAWAIYLSAFILAWIGQFIGHKIEGAKPSFFDDLKFLMVGPAWLLGFIYRKLGIGY